jgi:hypothetical protein
MEHRCGTRHEVDIEVYARSHGGVVSSAGWLRNLSASGGFLVTTLPIDPPAHISLRVVDAGGRFPSRLEGHVVRRTAEGLGIEWAEYAPELVSQLGNSPPHGAEEEMSRSEAVSE